MKWMLLLLSFLMSAAATSAQPAAFSQIETARLSVQVVDLTPRFLKFYDSATVAGLDSESRWQLWKKMYGFAAIPPGPAGEKMARTLLDNAWPKYPGVIDRVRKGASVLNPSPQNILERVARLLAADTSRDSIRVRLIVFVGGLENNAFAFTDSGVPTVAIPVETKDKDLELTMTHEFTHVVHSRIAGFSGAYVTTIAQLLMSEGLAMRVTEKLVPGYPEALYTSAQSDTWLSDANARRTSILRGVQQHLADSTATAMSDFTFGTGTTGLRREAYYAGWVIVGELEKEGFALADLAKLPAGPIRQLFDKTITEMVKADK
jgi:hypothetical protein